MGLPSSSGLDDSFKSGQPSPGILEVIREDNDVTTIQSITSPTSYHSARSIPEAPALPDATGSEIHLSSGTVLMVKTPESTAWRRSVYVQGTIKLPTPAVVPRKGSIATLDPFQDVLSNTPIPRRKSEDTCLDDICDWYDTWNYYPVSFAGDVFNLDSTNLVNDYALLPLTEEPGSPIDRSVRFPTPVPPLAEQVAAAMLRPDSTAIKPRPRMSMPMVPLPDLPKSSSFSTTSSENVSQKGHSRNSSEETSYKSASSDPIQRTDSRGSGVSGISSVEEKSWFENDGKDKDRKKRGSLQEGGEQQLKQKPARMSRMRRFVQTASAIL
jgi:hypothetical protein